MISLYRCILSPTFIFSLFFSCFLFDQLFQLLTKNSQRNRSTQFYHQTQSWRAVIQRVFHLCPQGLHLGTLSEEQQNPCAVPTACKCSLYKKITAKSSITVILPVLTWTLHAFLRPLSSGLNSLRWCCSPPPNSNSWSSTETVFLSITRSPAHISAPPSGGGSFPAPPPAVHLDTGERSGDHKSRCTVPG